MPKTPNIGELGISSSETLADNQSDGRTTRYQLISNDETLEEVDIVC